MAWRNHSRHSTGSGEANRVICCGEPAVGVGPCLGIMMQTQQHGADGPVIAVAVNLNEILRGDGKIRLPGVMRLKLLVQRFLGEQAGFAGVEHGQLRVEAKFVEMLAHEPKAKAVQCANGRGVEQRELFGQVLVEG